MAKKAANILAEAQTELTETNQRLADCSRRRDQLLLAGDERGLDAIEVELANLQKAAVRHVDRIRLLEEQARQEEAAAVVKRRGGAARGSVSAGHINRGISAVTRPS
jgi:hypothetical protein